MEKKLEKLSLDVSPSDDDLQLDVHQCAALFITRLRDKLRYLLHPSIAGSVPPSPMRSPGWREGSGALSPMILNTLTPRSCVSGGDSGIRPLEMFALQLLDSPGVATETRKFLSVADRKVEGALPPEEWPKMTPVNCVYAHQGEIATVWSSNSVHRPTASSKVRYLGGCDATTCILMFVSVEIPERLVRPTFPTDGGDAAGGGSQSSHHHHHHHHHHHQRHHPSDHVSDTPPVATDSQQPILCAGEPQTSRDARPAEALTLLTSQLPSSATISCSGGMCRVTSAVHFDGVPGQEDGFFQRIREISQNAMHFAAEDDIGSLPRLPAKIHMVGAFCLTPSQLVRPFTAITPSVVEGNLSHFHIGRMLTAAYKHSDFFDFSLGVCCVEAINTILPSDIQSTQVRLWGAACDVDTGELLPAEFPEEVSPDVTLRSVLIRIDPKEILQTYDWRSHEYCMRWEFWPRRHSSVARLQSLIALDSPRLLAATSTSPWCEPANYCARIRDAYRLICDNPDAKKTLWKGQRKIVYTLDVSQEKWIRKSD